MDAWKTVAASGYEISIAADELRKLYEAKPAGIRGGGQNSRVNLRTASPLHHASERMGELLLEEEVVCL